MADSSDSTRALLLRWHDGDDEALHQLLVANVAWIAAYVRQRMGDRLRDRIDSHDVVQEVALDALRYGPRFIVRDSHQFRSLLAKIVENTLRDQHDWANARRRAAELEVPVPSDSTLDLSLARGVTRPSVAVDRKLHRQWVRLALELLQPEDRQIIRLRDWDGLSFERIGEELGVAWNAARMRYQRALPKLGQKIRELQQRPGGFTDGE